VSALSKQSLVVEANYVDFGSDGSVVGVTHIRTVQLTGSGREAELVRVDPTGFPTPLYGGFQAMSDYDGFQAMPDYTGPAGTRRRRWPRSAR
jgi:hypothetical protein